MSYTIYFVCKLMYNVSSTQNSSQPSHTQANRASVRVCVCVCLIETITEQVRPALADLRRKILKHQRICFKYFKLSGNFTICYCNFYYSSKQSF